MRTRRRTAQSGFAALLLLAILVTGSLYALLSGINTATADLQQKRDDATGVALRQAKEALIAYAATRPTRPGALPCPDLNNNGIAGGAGFYGNNSELFPGGIHGGFNCPDPGRQMGRLPWRTLGLPDLRDAGGERLWYVMSGNFRNDGSQIVNSDTPGQLSVAGVAPAAGVVAIIFAPGQPLAGAGQNRSGAGINDVVQYLEGGNAGLNPNFVSARRCEQAAPACPLGPFNDQFVTITHQELFEAVENAVERRLAQEIAPLLRLYRDQWAALGGPGFYPFAVPFMNPGPPGGPPTQDTFCGGPGTPGTASGLPPVSQAAACSSWAVTPGAVTENGAPSGFLVSGTCAAAPPNDPDMVRISALKCTVTTGPGSPNVKITMPPLLGAANALVVFNVTGAGWAVPTTGVDPATGNVTLEYNGNAPANATTTVTIALYSAPARFQQTGGADTSWFFNNDWYRHTYYAVAPPRLPGGAATCTIGVDCLTVLNGPAPPNDKQVVLLLAGRAINGVVRPSALPPPLADFFELENDETVANQTFVRQPRSTTFNDKVVIVAPCAPPGPSPCP